MASYGNPWASMAAAGPFGLTASPLMPAPTAPWLQPVVQPQNPLASLLSGVPGFLKNNSNALIGLGAGIAGGGPDLGQAIGRGLELAGQGRQADYTKQQQATEDNATRAWLQANYPQYANLPVSEGWQAAMQDAGSRNSRGITPSGYRWKPDQTLEPIPGGPADPNSAQSISPEALDIIATQYLAGDKSAITGFARNANMRALISNAIAQKANALGMDGKAIAAEISAYGGNVAAQRAAGTRAAQVGMAASEANQMADIALKASTAVPRGSFVPWNAAVNAYNTNTSSPEMAAFVTATTSLVNAYARAVSPLGAPTDAMRQHAEEMLNTAQSPEAYAAVINQMKKEMEAALNAPAEISGNLKTSITGLPPDVSGNNSGDVGSPPPGVDATTWSYMTPDERALWQN